MTPIYMPWAVDELDPVLFLSASKKVFQCTKKGDMISTDSLSHWNCLCVIVKSLLAIRKTFPDLRLGSSKKTSVSKLHAQFFRSKALLPFTSETSLFKNEKDVLEKTKIAIQ